MRTIGTNHKRHFVRLSDCIEWLKEQQDDLEYQVNHAAGILEERQVFFKMHTQAINEGDSWDD